VALLAALRRGTARDGLPYKLTLILTRRCPTRCSFCSIWKTPSPDELTPDEWARVFAAAPHTAWVNLSGGEIFQRADLPAIVDALVSSMPGLALVDFPTTGYFPGRAVETCERLVAAGVSKVAVTVSLDGPPELHDRLRGRAGAFEQACEAMRALRAAKLPRVSVYFGTTLYESNTAHIEAMIEAARARVPGLTASDVHLNLGMESGHYYRNEGGGHKAPPAALAAVERHRRRGLDVVSLVERAYQRRVRSYLASGRSPVPCAALRASVFVDPQGVVYPCSIYDRPLGALRDNGYDLARVLGLGEARSARRAVAEDRCPGCWTPCEAYQSLFTHWLARPERPQAGFSGNQNGSASEAYSQSTI